MRYWHDAATHFQRPVSFKLSAEQLKLMIGLGDVRVYRLDDLLRRLGKDYEVCVYGPAKRRFLKHDAWLNHGFRR